MNGATSDYIAMKLSEARQKELIRESEKDRLVMAALKNIKPVIRLPRIRINHN